MNLFDLSTEQPPKGIALTKQGGWVGKVDIGDVVNMNNETFRVVGPPQYNLLMLRAEIANGYVLTRPDGSRTYHDMQDMLHRDDGPAIIFPDGAYTWFQRGMKHREDGPAQLSSSGTQRWYIHGQKHREDGPAVIYADGTKEYWLYDKRVKQEDLL